MIVNYWTHSTFGFGAFPAASPGLWNSLPPHLRDADLPSVGSGGHERQFFG